MLKRQRQPTPPPSSFGDPPSFLPDVPIRPLQPSLPEDPFQPRFKRQRIRPPPLDGALRGWLQSESAGAHWESDGEEDWTGDASDAASSLPPPSTTMVDQYKDANSLLHELHVLNQHRLLFANYPYPRNSRLNSNPKAPLPTADTHNPPAGQRTATWADRSSYNSTLSRPARDRPVDPNCCSQSAAKGLVEEVQSVRQRYEDANRFLGSLFLSRRREMEGVTSSGDPGPSG